MTPQTCGRRRDTSWGFQSAPPLTRRYPCCAAPFLVASPAAPQSASAAPSAASKLTAPKPAAAKPKAPKAAPKAAKAAASKGSNVTSSSAAAGGGKAAAAAAAGLKMPKAQTAFMFFSADTRRALKGATQLCFLCASCTPVALYPCMWLSHSARGRRTHTCCVTPMPLMFVPLDRIE